MRSATSITVSTFGVVAGLAGIEHGIGEIAQGNQAPDGVTLKSWPDSDLFAILDGEPAMTIVPNLLLTGVLAVLVSLAFLVWVTMFIQRPHGGMILILLSVGLLLVGGGFGPPLLGIILGIAATRNDKPLTWWSRHLPAGWQRSLSGLWPWSLGAGLVAWLLLMPGTIILNLWFGLDNAVMVAFITFTALGLLLLTILTGLVRDIPRPISMEQMPVFERSLRNERVRSV